MYRSNQSRGFGGSYRTNERAHFQKDRDTRHDRDIDRRIRHKE